MKWRRDHHHQQQKKHEETKTTTTTTKKKKNSISSTFSLLLSKLKTLATRPKPRPDQKPSPSTTGPDFQPASPKTDPPVSHTRSAFLSFSPASLDRLAAETRRRSTGDDDNNRLHRLRPPRSARHNSAGDLDLRPILKPDRELQHLRRNLPIRDEIHRRRPPVKPIRTNRDEFRPKRRVRRKVRPRIRVCSPRPSADAAPVARGLERFAVVKCSCDPQRDFRESMVEMIWEKGIGSPEELERLLACYLSLNSDEHHDAIVKVFRQIWFELNPDRFGSEYYCCRRLSCRGC